MTIKDKTKTKKMRCSEDVVEIFKAILQAENEIDQDKEHFWVMGLDVKNTIKYLELVSLGSLSSGIVHPRETYRLACIKAVASIVAVHNHPSGDPTPSQDDIEITNRLKKSGDILGIKMLDHIIIGENKHFSFIDQKML
tara:strand:+ start:345 stop:761 length:417 start_codon:yes stop_codon:yes gene_type:complete